MRSFSTVLPFGFELATYAAPSTITGLRRLLNVDRSFMADGGCLARVTVLGQFLEVWAPTVGR